MKMHPDHVKRLTKEIRAVYVESDLRDCLIKGHTNRYYRWDCLHRADIQNFVCRELFPYLTDDDIDEALEHIIETRLSKNL